MANSFIDLENDIMKAVDVVARETVGFSTSCSINVRGSENAAKGDTVRSSFTRPAEAEDIVPSMTIPEGTDQTVDNKTLTISKAKGVKIPITGEEVKHLDNGIGYVTVFGDQIQQAMRTITNLVEIDLFTEAYTNSSRAVGTAGTTPFASNHNVVNEARQILVDNGVPIASGMISLVMGTSAGTNLRNLSNLYKVNEAGNSTLLRQGVLDDISGIMLKESFANSIHTKGTGTGYLVNNASGYAIADETILTDTGSGTLLAGDVVTFAGDSNKYVNNVALSGGSFSIGEPGLRAALADNAAITIGNNYTPHVMFHQSALELAMRAPADPIVSGVNLSSAVFSTTIRDPKSGLTFAIKMYGGYNKGMIEVSATWGYKAWMPKYIATVIG